VTIDLAAWRAGGADAERVERLVDEGLQRAGFLLVTGHGVPRTLAGELRAAARRFFALPIEIKAKYSARVGGRGWQALGVEANGYSEGTATPPDMKESIAIGADAKIGDEEMDALWYVDNVWPDEVAEFEALATAYSNRMRALADDLLRLCALAVGQPKESLAGQTARATWTFNINHYPPLTAVGEAEPGQFRIGPHTDFGMVTILDREPGSGGLQVFDPHRDSTGNDGWQDAPFDPDALTVNIGDLLAYWSGDRWLSGRHRVLPPQPSAPNEDLVSLVYFYELNPDAVIHPLAAPIGRGSTAEPVVAGTYLKAKLDAISVS